MHLKVRKGFVLVNLMCILMLLSVFSSIVASIVINNIKKSNIKPYVVRDKKTYEANNKISDLNSYLVGKNDLINELKSEGKKLQINSNMTLEYDKRINVFILKYDDKFILLKEDSELIPYSYRY